MTRTLIVYGTRRGTTELTVAVLAETLILKYKHAVEVVDIRRIRRYRKRLDEFDHFIIGSSIVRGKWISKVLRFLIKNDFEGRNVALFVTAGNTMNKVIRLGIKLEQAREEAIEKYIDKYLDKISFIPIDKTAFGGKIVRRGEEKVNTWNREEIESWALRLGKLFKEKEQE